MTGKNKYTLPNHIIPFKNPDKKFQESATDLLFMPHSSRVILYGGPSSGKTTAILNMCLHQNYDRIIVFHNDSLKNINTAQRHARSFNNLVSTGCVHGVV